MYIITLNHFMQPVIHPVVRKISNTYETTAKVNRFIPEECVIGTTETRAEAEERVKTANEYDKEDETVILQMEKHIAEARAERLHRMKRILRG